MRRALPSPLPLAAALAATVRIASAGNVAADILDTIALGADSLGTETTAALAVECDAAVAGGLAVVGDAVFSNGIARVAPGGGLDAANPDLAWSGREPAWWTDYGVLNGEPPNDEAAATAGQLKWIASRARAMLDDAAWSAGGAGAAVSNLVETLPPGSNSLAVAATELKRIARPFAQRCIELHIDCAFSTATAVSAALAPGPRDGEIVTVGQIKRLFDFDPSIDADANAIPDWWERLHGVFDPDPPGGAPDPDRDSDGDGLSDAAEFALGTDPVSPDTDGDGLSDADELASGTNPLDPDTDGDGLPDGEETPRILRDADIPWFVLSNALVVASGSWDDKAFSFGVDPVRLGGLLCTNLAADSNGRVFFRDAFHASSVSSSRQNATSSNAVFHSVHACVAAYWTDLCLRSELGSKIRTGTHGPFRVVQYEDVGFRANATNRVSFQLAAASNAVFATYAAIEDARPDKTTTFAAQGPGANPNLWYGVGAPTLPLAGRTIGYHFGTGSSPFLADTDGDGVPDGTEVALGLHPGRADTDRDGLPDAWELAVGLDPLDSTGDDGGSGDPDGDGRTNAQELSAGTDPFLADTDGDGIPDGSSASSWNNHSLWGAVRHETNLVIVASASVPTNASACLRIGSLSIPLADGEHVVCLRLQPGTRYSFRIRCTGGATVSAQIVPPEGGEPQRLLSPPRSNLPGFALDDPAGGFSGLPRGRADGTMAAPLLQLVSRDGLGPCVHETPGSRQWNVSISPGNWSEWSPRAEIEGFEISGTIVTLAVEDEPRSITNGTIRIASTEPGFPPAEVSRSIHRCEYDPATGACPLCGETHDTTGVSITVTQDYRYALFGETNMSRFAATAHGGNADDVVWTVSPELADGVWLHASDDPESVGEGEIAGAAQVWADSGFCTNSFTITAAFPFAPDKSVSKTFTTVAIDAEAICAETDPSGFVVNPISVPIGETATFRVKVFPASVPDNHVEWRIVYGADNATFVGSRFGRDVHLRGVAVGDVWLEVHISGYNGPIPQFQTTVMPLYDVPVVAWIVCDDDGHNPATTESRIRTMVDQANYLFRQVCISCYVHQINYTNHADWLNLGTWGTPDFSTNLQQMTAVSNPVAGIEVHFVDDMVKAVGVNSTNGMALSDQADFHTFAHEAGHAMELADIYSWHPDTSLKVTGSVRRNWSPLDWCGDPDRGFYPDADCLPQSNLVERLVMCGVQGGPQCDFSWGGRPRHPENMGLDNQF